MKFSASSKKVFAVFAVLLAMALVITGCGSAQSGSAGGKAQIAYYAYNSEPVLNWDPSVEFSNGIVVMNNIYETLLKYDPINNKIEDVLATSYTKSDDGLTWTFHIRKGVKFHDGTDLNAEAVKFSIDRTKQLGQGAAYIWDSVKEIKVVDDYTVEFDLSYTAPLDLVASSGYAAFIVSPTAVKAHPDDWLSSGNEAGTGPYMLQSQKMGDQVVMTKFNDYWKGWNGKHFDKVVIQKVPETASRRQMVEKGDADVTIELPYEDVEAMKSNSSVQVDPAPSFENLLFFFNTQKAPLDNKLVRQALSYAFPYSDVIKYAMGGYATQSKGTIPQGLWGHSDDLAQYTYDMSKAKSLLDQAGFKGGLKLSMTYMSGDEAEKKASELYKAELNKLGIELDIRAMPWDTQWAQSKNTDPSQRQDIMAMYWWPDYASPYSWLLNLFHTEKQVNYNVAYWYNDQFDKLIDAGNVASGTDRTQAEKDFGDAQKIMVDEAPAIFAYDKQFVWVMNKNFKGFVNNPIYPNVVFFYDTYRE